MLQHFSYKPIYTNSQLPGWTFSFHQEFHVHHCAVHYVRHKGLRHGLQPATQNLRGKLGVKKNDLLYNDPIMFRWPGLLSLVWYHAPVQLDEGIS